MSCAWTRTARNRSSVRAGFSRLKPALTLKRHFVVFFDLRGGGGCRAAFASAGVAAAGRGVVVIPFAVEHLHVVCDDLRTVPLLSRLLVVPTVIADGPIDVDELPFAQILPADLGELAPGHDVVPLGALLLLAGAVGETLIGGERELGDAGALRRRPDLRVLAEAADQNDFVNA